MDDIILYYRYKEQPQKKTLREQFHRRGKKQGRNVLMSMRGPAVVIAVTLNISGETLNATDFTQIPKWLIKVMEKHRITERDITHCWYEPSLAMRLGVGKFPLSLEFLMYVKERLPFTDSVYLIDGMQDGLYEFAEELVQGCNHFTIILPNNRMSDLWDEEERARRMEMWEEFAEDVYGDLGLMVQIVSEFLPYTYTKVENNYQKIVYDFAFDDTIEWRRIPTESIYVDFAPNQKKMQWILKKREDVSYCNYGNFLDITAENGYNNLV